jgi:hypothetical protein
MMTLPPSFMRGSPYLQARKAPRTCTAEQRVEGVLGILGHRDHWALVAGVAEEHIDRAEARDGPLDVGARPRRLADVCGDGVDVRAGKVGERARAWRPRGPPA